MCVCVCVCVCVCWVQVTPDIILNNITPPNNLSMNLYFKNSTIGLHLLYVLKIHANFHINQILFTIQSINSSIFDTLF